MIKDLFSKSICLAVVLMAIFLSSAVYASQTRIGVVFPKADAAYGRVFDEIIAGIQTLPDVVTVPVQFMSDATTATILEVVEKERLDVLISLGQGTYQLTQPASNQLPVVHGGLMLKPNGHNGVTLVGDPEKFLAQLKTLAPRVKRVYAVYGEDYSGWLMHKAEKVAPKYDIELKTYPAVDIRDAVIKYREVLERVRNGTDAIWLTLDDIIPDRTILPPILEAAWERRLVVFSNNPSHTRRGALFALFPDNYGLGKSLGELAVKQAGKQVAPQVVPANSLRVSVNERTASHLGLNYSQNQWRAFDVIYPAR